tara:strand:+ start:75 stop:233 length:159 start_codon:yes stop_codon:yes gene_type:complete
MKDKAFKKHKMYCHKEGTVHMANVLADHERLKKKGCGHKAKKGMQYKPAKMH